MKMLYFPRNSSNIFFCDPCFYATVQTFRLLDCYTVCDVPEAFWA